MTTKHWLDTPLEMNIDGRYVKAKLTFRQVLNVITATIGEEGISFMPSGEGYEGEQSAGILIVRVEMHQLDIDPIDQGIWYALTTFPAVVKALNKADDTFKFIYPIH